MRLAGAALTVATLSFGGCAQQPQQFAAASHGKEYFPSSKYGPASRRVVADGPIPHGGGQYLVGRPYTVAGQTYYPSERRVTQVGNASWYGDAFHGRLTANGEIYDKNSFTAAHPTMPLPSYARVTNLRNNSSMIVRVNDRGPYASNRVMDVSGRVAEALDFKRYGTAKIKVEYVGRASLAGSDDARLFATLRTNGPAPWQGEPTMVAAAEPPAHVASLAPYVPETRRETEQPDHSARIVTDEARRPIASPDHEDRFEPRDRDRVLRGTERNQLRTNAISREAAHVDTGERGSRSRSVPVHREALATREDRRPRILPEPPRHARQELVKFSFAKIPEGRISEGTSRGQRGTAILPPSRPVDLRTTSSVHSKMPALRKNSADARGSRPVPLRLARSRDD